MIVSALGGTALVFLISAGAWCLVGRVAIRLLSRVKCVAPARYEDCPELLAYHKTKRDTPTMGGLVVLGVGLLVAAASGGLATRDGWLIVGAIVGLAAVGLVDDCLKVWRQSPIGIRTLPKLIIALAMGAGVGIAGLMAPAGLTTLELPWLSRTVELGWMWVPFSMVVMAGSAHAVNLTDGMDGLAAGCVAIALVVLGLLILDRSPEDYILAIWCASLAGACVGFLWFNTFPATIVLGDVGALGLGAALGVISLLSHTTLWLLVIGGVFVAEAVSVLLQVSSYKWRGKRRIFRVAPIHHHFQLSGISESKVVVRFWIVGLCLAVVGLTTIGKP